MNDKLLRSDTNCNACGKEWKHGETFIVIDANCIGYAERDGYTAKDAHFGSIQLGIFCEECAAKTEQFQTEIRYDEIRMYTAESYMDMIDEASKHFP